MSFALFVIGAALAAPQLKDENVISYRDYPLSALKRQDEGATIMRLVVSREGKPDHCEVLSSTGNRDMDRASCSAMMRRAEFTHALDQSGQPTYGVLIKINNFWLPELKSNYPLKLKSDLSLKVKQLPGGSSGSMTVSVNVLIDEVGLIKVCEIPPDEAQQKLAKLGCDQLLSLSKPEPVNNSAGIPISYVKAMKVSFEAE